MDDESGRRALLKHKNRIGNRYIELFRTTQAEVQQIINRVQQRPAQNLQPTNNTNTAPMLPPHFQPQIATPTTLPQVPMQTVQFQVEIILKP